ncbi:MAG: FGGY family carbohydrate kinase, partial [Planctomycetota bacterium]
VELLKNSLSLPFARIWRTSCTVEEADRTRRAVGGKERIIKLSGSNAPLRFSAFGLRKTARDFPEEYRSTRIIHQISSLIPALLAGNIDVALDYGNACGTSLMDYARREWSSVLLDAVSEDLPGGRAGLLDKLPRLASGTSLVGRIAGYFVERYGFNPRCKIAIGSGDNPQAKVLVAGSLLSLGTSFVIMIETDGRTFDMEGHGNAMYDAFDRPFMFGCRTNGALRWDNVRAEYGMGKQDYERAEAALRNTPAGNNGRLFLWQAEKESFPLSDAFGPVRVGYKERDFAADYVGIVESTLASLYLHSRNFTGAGRALYVTGGPAGSPEILRRVAAIWNTEVVPVEKGGAALGAAVSGAYALLLSAKKQPDPGDFGSSFLSRRESVRPLPGDIALYHGPGGYLEKYEQEEAKLMAKQGQR